MRDLLLKCFYILVGLVLPLTSVAQPLTKSMESLNGKLVLTNSSVQTIIETDSHLIGDIIDYASVNSSQTKGYILSSGSGGILKLAYPSKVTEQILKFGRGPGEVVQPSAIFSDVSFLYIWDEKQLKLIRYNYSSKSVDLELKNFRYAISDLAVYQNLFIRYNSGETKGKYIELYDMEKNEFIKEVAERNNKHSVLMSIEGNGGLTLHDHYLFYVSPEKPVINRLNLRNYELTKSERANDPKFNVPDVGNVKDLVLNRNEMKEFMFSSSMVTDIFALKDYLIVKAKVGENSYSANLERYTTGDRKIRFYIYDYELNYIDTFSFSMAVQGSIQSHFWTTNGSQLMLVSLFDIFNPEPKSKKSQRKIYYWNIRSADPK